MAVELGISPVALLDAPDGILEAMTAYLREKQEKQERG
jgi:hypothetical protein